MRKKRFLALLVAVMMTLTAVPQIAWGAEELSDIEWWNFRNSKENNGVTDRETPVSYEETALKWATKMAEGYTQSCTPPLILDGYVYTAQGRYVYKLDKETGEKKAESPQLEGLLGYALNPILYAEGMLFVQIDKGRVQALDAKTLESLWVSEAVGGQTLSPITYQSYNGKGYIYTGTWTGEITDGTYLCLEIGDEDPDNPIEEKKCTWKFVPSQQGQVDEKTDSARGFYWAGSYAAEGYVAFGADDGSAEGDYSPTATFYTVNPETGAVIDKLTGLNGDVRTTTVYSGGYLYFATKGGSLYKVSVTPEGKLGEPSSIDLKGMMTAAPVIYNGRIYIGICGEGGQFDKDGGHMFAVINDDQRLSQSSLAYTVPISGYPQAAALLSTAYAQEDGTVYLYFTYNSPPGGIYYLKDRPGQTQEYVDAHQDEVLAELYSPPAEMQQYCISTICCDEEGTLYYKNDSGYLMAVEKNRAYLEGVSVTADTGDVQWSRDFRTGDLSYELITESGTDSVDFALTLPQGVSASVKLGKDGTDQPCADHFTCELDEDGSGSAVIIVERGGQSREYSFTIRGKTADASLADLTCSTSNTWNSSRISLVPEFEPSHFEYETEVILTENRINLWPLASDAGAKIKVIPVENVTDKGVFNGELEVTGTSQKRDRYAVYIKPGETTAKVKIQVTSENGAENRTYAITLIRDASVSGVGLTLNKTSASIFAKGPGNTVRLTAELTNSSERVQWTSSNPAVASVSGGAVTGVSPGSAVITASVPGTDVESSCEITVKEPTLSLNRTNLSLYTCDNYRTASLSAVVNGLSGQNVSWKVTKGAAYVSVSAKGTVAAKKAGSAVITASANGVSKNCTVQVKKAGFKVSPETLFVQRKKTAKIRVTGVTPKGKALYRSTNRKIATVTAQGRVRGKKNGKTWIHVTCNGITKKVRVKVVKKLAFKLKKSSAAIRKNKTMKIRVKEMAPRGKVTYKSANRKIASVTKKGVVKGKKKGKTYIKVTCNGITKKFRVKVK